MFCRKCGIENKNEAKFCRGCGNDLQSAKPLMASQKAQVESAPITPAIDSPESKVQPLSTNSVGSKFSDPIASDSHTDQSSSIVSPPFDVSRKKLIFPAALALSILVIAALGYVFYSRNQDIPADQSTPPKVNSTPLTAPTNTDNKTTDSIATANPDVQEKVDSKEKPSEKIEEHKEPAKTELKLSKTDVADSAPKKKDEKKIPSTTKKQVLDADSIKSSTPNNNQVVEKFSGLVGVWESSVPQNMWRMKVIWDPVGKQFNGYLTKQGIISERVGFAINELVWQATPINGNSTELMEKQKLRANASSFTWKTGLLNISSIRRDSFYSSAASTNFKHVNDEFQEAKPSEKKAPDAAPVVEPEMSYQVQFKGPFGLIVGKRTYTTIEMRNKAVELWATEHKIMEPDGSVTETVPKQEGGSPIPGH